MKKLFADWRNWALAIAAIVIIYLVISVRTAGTIDSSAPIVRIGNHRITEKEFIANLKKQVGDKALTALMQRTLLQEYAATKKIEVTDGDVKQLKAFYANMTELQGQTLDDLLKSQNMTEDQFDLMMRMDILRIKLIVPKSQIEKAVAQLTKEKTPPFTLPKRYKIRRFIFQDAAAAKKAADMLKTEEGLHEVAEMALTGQDSLKVMTYVPMPNQQDPLLTKLLSGLKAGECSKPEPLQGKDGPVAVVQLVQALPEELPTMANRYLPVGLVLLNQYQKEQTQMQAEIMDKVEVIFYPKSTEYTKAVEDFKALKLENPNLPATTVPATGQKGTIGATKENNPSQKTSPVAVPAPAGKK